LKGHYDSPQNGRVAIFKSCGPAAHDVCSLVEMRYPGGGSIAYERDRSGRLTAIRTLTRAIALEYDAAGRIARGRESSGRTVTYRYDSRGRLDLVTTSDGVARRYLYSDRDEMLSIDEPGWRIDNTFDDGCLVKQVTHTDDPGPYTLEFNYTIVDGKVAANDVTEDDGTHTVYRFSDSHYVLSEIWDARGEHPISIAYDRRDNVWTAMTIRCWTPEGHVVRNVPTRPGWDDSVKLDVITRECRR
jgi:YD repeat-containing protein